MIRFTLSIVLAMLATAPAQAQQIDLPDRPIRRAEVVEVVKRQFSELDRNRDGVVDRAEFEAYLSKRDAARARGQSFGDQGFARIGGKWFERSDQNGDGKVTRAEAEVRPLKLFDMADTNGDGVVSVQERNIAMLLVGK